MSWLDWKQAASPQGAGARRLRRAADRSCATTIRCCAAAISCTARTSLRPALPTSPGSITHGEIISSRSLEQSGEAAVRGAARRANDDGTVPVLTLLLNPTANGPRLPACPRRMFRRACCIDSAEPDAAGAATSRARRSRSRRAARSCVKAFSRPIRHERHSRATAVRCDAARSTDRTRFRLWAPAQEHGRRLQIEGARPMPMQHARRRLVRGRSRRAAPARAIAIVLASRARACPIRRRARRPTTCTARASWSIRAAYRWRNRDWRGRPWHETVLYELHVGVLGGFAGVQRELAAAGRPRHHRGRADADQ